MAFCLRSSVVSSVVLQCKFQEEKIQVRAQSKIGQKPNKSRKRRIQMEVMLNPWFSTRGDFAPRGYLVIPGGLILTLTI